MADFKVTELDVGMDFGNLPYWDVVIIGAGPAGLAAGLTTAHRGLTTLIIEAKDQAGGQPQFLYADKRIVDIPGFPDGISGAELSERVYRQAVNALVQFRFQEELLDIEDTDQVEKQDPLKRVVTSRDQYPCRKVIIACGLLHFPRKLPVLDRLNSQKVHYKIPKIGDYEGQRVAVVGGGDSALDAAVMVLQRNGQVELIVRGEAVAGKADTLARVKESAGVVRTSCEVRAAEFQGDQLALTLNDGQTLQVSHVIVQIGFLSAKDTFQRLGVRLNEDASIAIDPYFETSRRGIFAVGAFDKTLQSSDCLRSKSATMSWYKAAAKTVTLTSDQQLGNCDDVVALREPGDLCVPRLSSSVYLLDSFFVYLPSGKYGTARPPLARPIRSLQQGLERLSR